MGDNDMDRVVPLGQLDDFKVADGDPDVRGWEVLSSDGRKIGEVDELLVDTAAMKVRYLDVDVEAGMGVGGHDRHVLIPIGYARLDEARDCVMLDALALADLGGIPSYDQGPLTRDFEASVRQSFAGRGGGFRSVVSGEGGMVGMTGDVSGGGMRGADSDLSTGRVGEVPMHSTGPSAGVMASGGDALGGGERVSAGSQGPAGGLDREERAGGMGALNERADELGYDRDAVRMRGDASHGAGLAGSDYLHNADEDFYASDAFDDARFYGARRGGTGGAADRGLSGSGVIGGGGMDLSRETGGAADRGLSGPGVIGGGGMALNRGTGGADPVDPLSGSGLQRGGAEPGPQSSGMGDGGADLDETRRLAQDARELLREDQQNRDVPRGGNL